MDTNQFIVSCLESKVEEGGKLYGKFFIGPCNPGQGTTLGTALRRNLLSELSGIGIVATEIKGADHEYCSLPGVRESVLDIILNLKGLAFMGDIIPEEPCIGFLNVSGPMEVKARHIKFPFGISPVKEDHHIATVSYDGKLSLKVFLIKGKNYMIHNSSTIPKVEALKFISKTRAATKINNKINNKIISFTNVTAPSRASHRRCKGGHRSEAAPSSAKQASHRICKGGQRTPRREVKHNTRTKIQLKSFWNEYSQKDPFSPLSSQERNQEDKGETSIYFDAFVELLQKNSLEFFTTKNESYPISSFQKRVLRNWKVRENILLKPRKPICPGFYNLFRRQETFFYSSSKKITRSSILPVDGLFLPVERVNFRVETDISNKENKEHLILEIWTNGAIHPRQALYESAENLINILSYFYEKDLNHYQHLLNNTELQDEIILNQDIANISLPLYLFIQLKKLHINTIQDLSKSLHNSSLTEEQTNLLTSIFNELK
jgi:DNA-directed RNA polymerase alpha subunit